MNDDKIEGQGRDKLLSKLAEANRSISSMIDVIEGTMLVWPASQAAHEANRAFCEYLGDMSQKPWDEAPQWQKDSAGEGVWAIIGNVNITPEELHISRTKLKQEEGWVYGPVKDVEAKTHPCLVPYEELPKEQQFKDALFGAVVRGVLGISKEPKT